MTDLYRRFRPGVYVKSCPSCSGAVELLNDGVWLELRCLHCTWHRERLIKAGSSKKKERVA